jgi:ABC-type transport system involved in cytochrome c biogenesis permease subunit
MLAHGFQVINVLAAFVLIAVGIVIFLFFSNRKPSTLAITFAGVIIGLCLFLLYLIMAPQP